MSTSAILHIVNQGGGGTMRYIEALIHTPCFAERHFVFYVSRHQHVLFDVSTPYYYAFSADLPAETQRQLILSVIKQTGIQALGIHLHSFAGSALALIENWSSFPITATFHDHHFLSENPFDDGTLCCDKRHIAHLQHVLKASPIIVPSDYLLEQASPFFLKAQLHVIPHGVEAPRDKLDDDTLGFVEKLKHQAQWQDNKLTVATIGAIGEDKGLAFMKAWLAQKGDIQFVCLGYTADFAADKNRPQVEPGHIIHGFYHHAEVPELLKAYAVDVVLFFPGVAESFCYALSDIGAVVPVLAPDYGALGERVTKERLGQVYGKGTSPSALNQRLFETAEMTIHANKTPQTLDAMSLQTAHYYQHQEIDKVLEKTFSPDELSELLADQLHDDNLKWELATLVRQHVVLEKNVEDLKKQRELDVDELRKQQTQLEEQAQYIETLKSDIFAERAQIQTMQNSISWKVTKPLRAIRRLMK